MCNYITGVQPSKLKFTLKKINNIFWTQNYISQSHLHRFLSVNARGDNMKLNYCSERSVLKLIISSCLHIEIPLQHCTANF